MHLYLNLQNRRIDNIIVLYYKNNLILIFISAVT